MLYYLTIVGLAVTSLLYKYSSMGQRKKGMPDGPPTSLFVGNMLQMSTQKSFLQLTEWKKKYGGLFSLTVGPSDIVVLSDRDVVKQVLDKRSAVSSDRPTSVLRQELLTGGDHILWMDATPEWRLMRKLIHADLTESMCTGLHAPLQHAESVQMLHDMMNEPKHWRRHIERFTNSVVLCIVYGIRSSDIHSEYLERFEVLLRQWAEINAFGATPPVDIFPVLNYVPERFFGNWKSRARFVHDEMRSLYDGLHQLVIRRRKEIGSVNSMIDRLLDQNEKASLTFHQISMFAGVTVKGGSDTSASILASFVLAMTLHPDVVKKAQAEIDSVVPEDRVPDASDFVRLPYVLSVIKEVQRWRPIVGIGVPHQLSEDMVLDGKLLPRGAMLLLNVWALHHDESRFPEPNKFDPDRFKDWKSFSAEYANKADPNARDHYAYGNGRRLCPGIHLAERNLIHAAAKMLWAFDFDMAIDEKTGEPIVPDSSIETGYFEGLTLSAKPFPVDLKPRSASRARAVNETFAAVSKDVFARYEIMGKSSL